MEYMELEVYSQSLNRAIVKMPSQSFPGLVLQGETLASLLRLVKTVHERSQTTGDTEGIDASRELVETIQKLVSHFESTLHRNGIPLPYSTVSTRHDIP
jgi:hypothetical protein